MEALDGRPSLGVAEASQTKVTSRSTHQFPSNPPRYLAKVPTSCVAGIRPAQAVDRWFSDGAVRPHFAVPWETGIALRFWMEIVEAASREE